MRNITVYNGQSLADIAVQECGAFEAVFSLAARNGLSVTDSLSTGRLLVYEQENIVKKQVVAMLAAGKVRPATEVTAEEMAAVPYGGISFMGIEVDFIVS